MNEKLHADCNSGTLPKGKSSTKGLGRTAPPPSSYVKLGTCTVPVGKGVDTSTSGGSLMYNEYIVYDIAQAKMKYLIKMRFNYK
jgi:hypothetical protein